MGGIGDFSRGYRWNVVVGGGGLVSLALEAESLRFLTDFGRNRRQQMAGYMRFTAG
jgi:hypothetical protein